MSGNQAQQDKQAARAIMFTPRGNKPGSPTPYNRYHILPIAVYRIFLLVAIVFLGVGSIGLLAGVVCPYWNCVNLLNWGPFMCLKAGSGQSLQSCTTALLAFKASGSLTSYTIAQALAAIAMILGFIATGVMVFLFIRFRRQQMFDSLQRYLTFAPLGGSILGAICGFVVIAMVYYNIGDSESITFMAYNAPCGIGFGVGALLLCFGAILSLLLALFREIQDSPAPPPSPKPQQPRPKPRPSVAPVYQPSKETPANPYGYTGDPINDSKMYWLHQYYHHWTYNRPTFPFMPPANTVPTGKQ